MKVYVDGVEQACTAGSACVDGKGANGWTPLRLPRNNAYIGRSNFNSNAYFNGSISDVTIVDGKALTAAAVAVEMVSSDPTTTLTTSSYTTGTFTATTTTTAATPSTIPDAGAADGTGANAEADAGEDQSPSSSAGLIAGIVVGLFAVGVGAAVLVRRKKGRSAAKATAAGAELQECENRRNTVQMEENAHHAALKAKKKAAMSKAASTVHNKAFVGIQFTDAGGGGNDGETSTIDTEHSNNVAVDCLPANSKQPALYNAAKWQSDGGGGGGGVGGGGGGGCASSVTYATYAGAPPSDGQYHVYSTMDPPFEGGHSGASTGSSIAVYENSVGLGAAPAGSEPTEGIYQNVLAHQTKFLASKMQMGKQKAAALGLKHMMGFDEDSYTKLITVARGSTLEAIKNEIAKYGNAEDKANLKHILGGTRWSDWSTTKDGRPFSTPTIEELLAHPSAMVDGKAALKDYHAVVLRLYTSSTYKRINDALRGVCSCRACAGRGNMSDMSRGSSTQHIHYPFPVTIVAIDQGLKMLRAATKETIYSDLDGDKVVFFWRGIADMAITDAFVREGGGSELACMSTSTSQEKAVEFATSNCPLIMRLVTTGFLQRGADVSFLSVYPDEKEVLYPPLTHLAPRGRPRTETFGDYKCQVIDVTPTFAS
jgi:hypothetical protein